MKTIAELMLDGYNVNIKHVRNYKVVGINENNKIFEKTLQYDADNAELKYLIKCGRLIELLPCGGRTEITIDDKTSGKEYSAFAMCHKNDNYDKKFGVTLCLKRLITLMEK